MQYLSGKKSKICSVKRQEIIVVKLNIILLAIYFCNFAVLNLNEFMFAYYI